MVGIRCMAVGCSAVLHVSLPVTSDEVIVGVLRSGWAAVGTLPNPKVIYIFCWPCAEKSLSAELLAEQRSSLAKIEAAQGPDRRTFS